MKVVDVIKALTSRDGCIVSNLGLTSRELFCLGDRASFFYMLGSMGLASSIGLGLSLSQKRKIYVLDGDGSVLMNLGTLSTIGNCAPPNFYLIILDDGAYSTAGNQPTHTAGRTDLKRIAEGAGISHVRRADTLSELEEILDQHAEGPLVVIAKTSPRREEVPTVPLNPGRIAKRFRAEVTGQQEEP
jgi:sulfopyruvate decarboxylase subunit beta